ncbi:hypothetical protein BD410DRAFT_784726 [Rickenella mellea]|uniref:Nucleotidylyl transferase n=1 Tax=Rickenella mellea TaxID=50990 RepID=A0A4Y7QFQ0_9AGAM|nr:hypothetical protein BD410DRAFT_784726 [Rickenella mellea]
MTSASHAAILIQRVQQRTSALEIVYKSHDRWPLRPVRSNCRPRRPIRISVLDSSFNPPTLAHLALAKSRPVHPFPSSPPPTASSSSHRDGNVVDRGDSEREEREERRSEGNVIVNCDGSSLLVSDSEAYMGLNDYDARLLLLSVRNADKSLASTDASYVQRIEMMIRLARKLESELLSTTASTSSTNDDEVDDSSTRPSGGTTNTANVAVAIIDEPTFVRKSSVLLAALQERIQSLLSSSTPAAHPAPTPQLTFLVGLDTLERMFAPRYYPSPDAMLASLSKFLGSPPSGEGSRVVCARRVMSEWIVPGAEDDVSLDKYMRLREDAVVHAAHIFVDDGSVAFFNLNGEEMSLSSSGVRKKVKDGTEWRDMVPPNVADCISQERLYV